MPARRLALVVTVDRCDAHTARLLTSVPVGASPTAPEGRRADVTNGDDDTGTVLRIGD
jgi:hypothetical protein